MVEVVEKPSFRAEDFDRSKKKPGVSAIIRLKNEEDFLELALASIEPFFDEFIVVYNGCTDRTPEIVEGFAAANEKRVKAFHYVPEVFPQGSEMQRRLPANDVNSLVHYYNFALSKATRQVCAKWDGDMIAAPQPFRQVMDRLRSARNSMLARWTSPWTAGFWWYSGVNLSDKDGKIFVIKKRPRAWGRYDHGLWPVSRVNKFTHDPRFELLNTRWLVKSFVGFVFFHLKGMKRDRGAGVYQLERNPNSPYKKLVDEVWRDPEVITLDEYCRMMPAARSLPTPESLGIRPLQR
jgi:glycosyltransferase involved in cell wall biosynthesis